MADLPDEVMASLLESPGADETILTRWSHCALTDSPAATLGRGLAEDIPPPEVNARTVLRLGDAPTADYLVVDRLGEGGMGIVFEAEQVYFGRRVALKMIKPALASDPAATEAFFREAVITSRLDHPGIIPVLDFGVSQDGRALYAMMKASGVAWHRIIRDKTLSENLAVFDRVADIVAYSHRQGILHRDIKPANVLLGNHGEVWLGDWGVALARQPDGTYSHAGPAGTPQYMSPEMAKCDAASIGPASDIYLLGAVLFEIITGSPPHDGENAGAALLNSARNSIHTADQTNGLLPIAYKAMAALPEHRYATVDELREAVKKRLRLNESVYRQQQADTHLSDARTSGDYELFQQAIAGYEEAIALSPENSSAKRQRTQALVEYADKALARGELELAASIVQTESGVDKRVVRMMQKIAGEKAVVAHQRRRRIRMNVILLGMAAVLFAGGIYLYFDRNGGGSIENSAANAYPSNVAPPMATQRPVLSVIPATPESSTIPERKTAKDMVRREQESQLQERELQDEIRLMKLLALPFSALPRNELSSIANPEGSARYRYVRQYQKLLSKSFHSLDTTARIMSESRLGSNQKRPVGYYVNVVYADLYSKRNELSALRNAFAEEATAKAWEPTSTQKMLATFDMIIALANENMRFTSQESDE